MEERKECQVKGCTWAVILCPELCAPHWWKLSKAARDRITRAQIIGQKRGDHPTVLYGELIKEALVYLNGLQGILTVYHWEDGDLSTRSGQWTWCAKCDLRRIHHGLTRGGESFLVCSECQSMVPLVLPGSQALPGLEVAQ